MAIRAKYATYRPQFYESSGGYMAAIASCSALTTKWGKKHVREMMRVLGILGVDTGYY